MNVGAELGVMPIVSASCIKRWRLSLFSITSRECTLIQGSDSASDATKGCAWRQCGQCLDQKKYRFTAADVAEGGNHKASPSELLVTPGWLSSGSKRRNKNRSRLRSVSDSEGCSENNIPNSQYISPAVSGTIADTRIGCRTADQPQFDSADLRPLG